ncbi:hypothetical protein CYMTET_32549, partial [Cymbomonas tetramitiformis]
IAGAEGLPQSTGVGEPLCQGGQAAVVEGLQSAPPGVSLPPAMIPPMAPPPRELLHLDDYTQKSIQQALVIADSYCLRNPAEDKGRRVFRPLHLQLVKPKTADGEKPDKKNRIVDLTSLREKAREIIKGKEEKEEERFGIDANGEVKDAAASLVVNENEIYVDRTVMKLVNDSADVWRIAKEEDARGFVKELGVEDSKEPKERDDSMDEQLALALVFMFLLFGDSSPADALSPTSQPGLAHEE